MIQFGAILSVSGTIPEKIIPTDKRLEKKIFTFMSAFFAFLPPLFWFTFKKYIDIMLENVLVGNFIIDRREFIFCYWINGSPRGRKRDVWIVIQYKSGKIGLFQVIAMIPGVSDLRQL